MCAVLRGAILELQSLDALRVAEAEEWVRGDESSSWPFAFHNICAVLDLEPTSFARGLLAWRDRVAEAAPRTRIRSSSQG
jgi:hypothetical protein